MRSVGRVEVETLGRCLVRSRVCIGILVSAVVFLLLPLAFLSPSAQAARIHQLELSETLPEEETPFGVAVNQATNHFYVASFGINGATSRVINFEENGQIDAANPELTGAPALEPFRVAVDNSGGLQEGYVYANDISGVVQQFDASGEATSLMISESSIPPNETPQEGGLPPVVNNGAFEPRAVAVGPSGMVFVADAGAGAASAHAIDQFTPAGTFVKQLAAGAVDLWTTGITVDASDDIYLARDTVPSGYEGLLGEGLFELTSSGECVTVGCAPIDPEPIEGVAMDQARERILTTGQVGPEQGRFSEYDASTGTLLGVTQPSQLHAPRGIGVEEASGEVIVADVRPSREGTIQIYGPAVEVGTPVTGAPEDISGHSAMLTGIIKPEGAPASTCYFQYVDSEEFAEHRFEDADTVACEPEGPFTGNGEEAVHAEIEGLHGGTTYYERLVAKNEPTSGRIATTPGETEEFVTRGPTVNGSEATEVGETAATLKGIVNPNGSATTYSFEYLTQARFEETGSWAGATGVPSGGKAIGAGTEGVEVAQRIEGLVPGTAYRFRLVAVSGAEETDGEEVIFSTYAPPGAGLPDGRRYEQVSPVDKNGANVQGALNAVQASPDGDRITFFVNTGIPGGEGAQDFPTYLATRAADGSGWSTQGLLPPASYGPTAEVMGWSEDLSDVYDFAAQAGLGRLLRRSSADRSLTQLGTLKANKVKATAFAGSSGAGMVALLESKDGGVVPGDLAGKQNLYAYDRGTGDLVVAGVLNPTASGGEPVVPPGGAMAGAYPWTGSTNAAGGAFGTLYTQAERAISADGKRVFFTAGETGQIYVRENPFAPQSAMSGERCTEAGKACTIRISAPEEGVADPGTPAGFLGASDDGNLAFFLDRGKLTEDATGGAGYDLYRYDLRTGKLADLTLDTTDKKGARVEGALGISESGEEIYFVAQGALTEDAGEAPQGETNLYVLEGADMHLIARLGTSPSEMLNWTPSSGLGSERTTNTARVSADGQTLLFRSSRPLTAYRSHGVLELYLYRAGQGISCVSCNPSGQAPAGPAGVQEIPPVGFHLIRNYAILTHNLSADGQRVIFDSADHLLSADKNNVNDVYEWELPGKGSCTEGSSAYDRSSGGCLSLVSTGGREAGPSWFGEADEEGDNAFFFTAQPLVAQDKDELVDVYDARVGGGIPAQEALPATPCHEEGGCLSHAEGEPATSTPRSPGANGTNVVPPHHCKRGSVRRHGKCVRRHKRHHRKHGHHHHKHHGKGKKHHGKGKKHHGKGKKRHHQGGTNWGGGR